MVKVTVAVVEAVKSVQGCDRRTRRHSPRLTISSTQLVIFVTLIANRVLHVAVGNLWGLWAAVSCKGKQEDKVRFQKLPLETGKVRREEAAHQTPTPQWKPRRDCWLAGWLPSVLYDTERPEIRIRSNWIFPERMQIWRAKVGCSCVAKYSPRPQADLPVASLLISTTRSCPQSRRVTTTGRVLQRRQKGGHR